MNWNRTLSEVARPNRTCTQTLLALLELLKESEISWDFSTHDRNSGLEICECHDDGDQKQEGCCDKRGTAGARRSNAMTKASRLGIDSLRWILHLSLMFLPSHYHWTHWDLFMISSTSI